MCKEKKLAMLILGITIALMATAAIKNRFMSPSAPVAVEETLPDSAELRERLEEKNLAVYKACKEDFLSCVALVEDFHAKPYYDGAARYTIGYGTTVYPDGRRVKRRDPEISKEYAKECVISHCDTHIWPWIAKYVEVELKKEQMLGLMLFTYNIGGENLTGHSVEGAQVGEASSFLKSLNAGDDPEVTARMMTGFSRAGGKVAKGLLKRHWIEAAIFLGVLTPEDLLELGPALFYSRTVDFYYETAERDADDFWSYDLSPEKVEEFKESNKAQHSVQDII